MHRLPFKLALFVVGVPAWGLDQYAPPRVGQLVTTVATALRARPDSSAASLQEIGAGTALRWIEGQRSGDFLLAIAAKGPAGWVAAQDVKIVSQAPAEAPGIVESASPPCAKVLKGCPVNGCAQRGTDHALFNSLKRRFPPPNAKPTPIDFSDLVELQRQADSLVGQGQELSESDRALLKDLKVKSGELGEGSVVRITGFLATGPLKPHANTGESVNCRLKTPANNDFHISMVESAAGTEFDGIVIEMIPQKRPAGWSLAQLAKLQQSRSRVLVTGALFYDNEHVVNGDPGQDLRGQPRRFSLWEVHPITSFLVCGEANGQCDPDQRAGWIELAKLK